MKLVFATHNAGKLREVQEILAPQFEVLGLTNLSDYEDIPETASTLEGNALIKARAIWQRHGLPCFSDDTGLEVDALGGQPGVYSARYAGSDKDPEANMDLLLQNLNGAANRSAQFRTSVALIWKGEEHLFNGVVRGTITAEKAGAQGFGYDPIFQPEGYSVTFAEMDSRSKNAISHRGRAIRALRDFLYKQA